MNSTIPNVKVNKTKFRDGYLLHGSGQVELSCWKGYRIDDHPKKMITDGLIFFSVACHSETFQISPEQTNAYFYLVNNQDRIRQCIIETLRNNFPQLLEEVYNSYDTAIFPNLSDLTPDFDFKEYIGPLSIQIEEDAKENTAYLTWGFFASWDTEHGFEVITHEERVIEISPQADLFKIYEDNGTAEEVMKKNDQQWTAMKPKKKWWKFW